MSPQHFRIWFVNVTQNLHIFATVSFSSSRGWIPHHHHHHHLPLSLFDTIISRIKLPVITDIEIGLYIMDNFAKFVLRVCGRYGPDLSQSDFDFEIKSKFNSAGVMRCNIIYVGLMFVINACKWIKTVVIVGYVVFTDKTRAFIFINGRLRDSALTFLFNHKSQKETVINMHPCQGCSFNR